MDPGFFEGGGGGGGGHMATARGRTEAFAMCVLTKIHITFLCHFDSCQIFC